MVVSPTPACPVRRRSHIGGKHLDAGLLAGLPRQTPQHLLAHAPLDLQQLLAAQAQGVEGALPLGVLGRQAVGHGGHHGGAFATAALRLQEAHVAVWHQAANHLVKPSGEPEEAGEAGFKVAQPRLNATKCPRVTHLQSLQTNDYQQAQNIDSAS